MKYKIHLTNFGYALNERPATFERAVELVREKGFDASIVNTETGQVEATYSVIVGLTDMRGCG